MEDMETRLRKRFMDLYVSDLRNNLILLLTKPSGYDMRIHAWVGEQESVVTLKDEPLIREIPSVQMTSGRKGIFPNKDGGTIKIIFPSATWEDINAHWSNVQAWLHAKEICKILCG